MRSLSLFAAFALTLPLNPALSNENTINCESYGRTYWVAYCDCAMDAALTDYAERAAAAASPRDISYDDLDAMVIDAAAACEADYAEGITGASDGRTEERAREMGELQRGLIDSRLWLLIEQQRADDIAAAD